MIEMTIYQKDNRTHTKFILLPGGLVFGEENFRLAKSWRDQGLLGPRSAAMIDQIAAAMEATITASPKSLKNHNYMRKIAWELAAELAAQAEADREASRRRRRNEEDEGPAPMSETTRQAINDLKQKWGEK